MTARSYLANAVMDGLLRTPVARATERGVVALGHRFPHVLPGRGAVVHALARRHDGRELVARLAGGGRLAVPATSDGVSYYIHGTCDEPGTLALLRRYLRPGSVVVDGGANLGFYTVLAAGLCGATGRVYAFEPQCECAGMIRRSLELNGYQGRAEIVEAALGDREYSSALFAAADPTRSGFASVLAHGWLAAEPVATVDVVTLDAYAARRQLTRLDLVKLDVEGAELLALKGMEAALERLRPGLLVAELWPVPRRGDQATLDLRDASSTDRGALVRWLGERGYSPFAIGPLGSLSRLDSVDDFRPDATVNIAFAPSSLAAARADLFELPETRTR